MLVPLLVMHTLYTFPDNQRTRRGRAKKKPHNNSIKRKNDEDRTQLCTRPSCAQFQFNMYRVTHTHTFIIHAAQTDASHITLLLFYSVLIFNHKYMYFNSKLTIFHIAVAVALNTRMIVGRNQVSLTAKEIIIIIISYSSFATFNMTKWLEATFRW